MTEYKAQKIAIRERMARTGEPYSVARRAVLSGEPQPGGLTGSWPTWIPKPWNEEIPEGRPWDEQIPEGKPWDEEIPEDSFSADQPWLAQYFADGAATEGISVHEFKARMASYTGPQWANEVPWPQDPGDDGLPDDEATERRANQAQERADAAQQQADEAQQHAEEAQGLAEEAADRAGELRDLADEVRDRIEEARELAQEASHERDEGMLDDAKAQLRDAEAEATGANGRAKLAEREAQRAQGLADREQERADRAQERADRAQETADEAHEWLHAGGHPGHSRPVPRAAHPLAGPGRRGGPPWWFTGRSQTRRAVPVARPRSRPSGPPPVPPAPPPPPSPPSPPGR